MCDLVQSGVDEGAKVKETPCIHTLSLLENVEHCGGEPEQAANMHMNRLSFTLK